jgi:hypothetical protein
MKHAVKKSVFRVSNDLQTFLNSKPVQRFVKKHPGKVFIAFSLEMESGCTVVEKTPLFMVKAAA